jgi:hypothetical protein
MNCLFGARQHFVLRLHVVLGVRSLPSFDVDQRQAVKRLSWLEKLDMGWLEKY